jgi:conjugative transfer signal peptidase TraF
MMKKKIYTLCVFLLFITVTVFTLFLLYQQGYRVNLSDSLPGSVYRVTPLKQADPIKHGDNVLIDLSQFSNPVIEEGIRRGYVSRRQKMLKQIGAVPDDIVVLTDSRIFINGDSAPMFVSSQDSRGGVLVPYPTPLVLSPDHYWLISAPYLGYDSRYFGPIERSAFTHRAEKVL